MPPRHGKTETFTIALPIFILLHENPRARILITAYNDRFARKLSRAIRNRFIELGGEVASDKSATDEWYTAAGGMVMARGVGSPPTGEGFDWIIIDDPVKSREQAESAAYRERLWDWYTDDLLTRLQPNGVLALIMTLWHEDDLGGRLAEAERLSVEAEDEYGDVWTKLIMPAIAEEIDQIGRQQGEALWPDQWPVDKLMRRRRAMVKADGERSWYALFQQRPSPAEGDFFNVTKLQFCDASQVPAGLPSARAWDVAASKGSGDWTAGPKMEGPCPLGWYYVTDMVRVRLDSGQRDALMVATAEQDGKKTRIGLPRDPAAAGKSQVAYWARMFAGFAFDEMPTGKDKPSRAGPLSSQINSGNVVVVRAKWTPEFVEELRTFPGTYDDQVDATGDAFRILASKRKAKVY